MNKGRVIVISGPSGAGKSTVLHRILANHPDYFFSVSATTRAPRPNEVPGVHYHFLTREQFRELLDKDLLMEYNEYAAGDYYGTPAQPILDVIQKGGTAVLDVDPNGAFQVLKKVPDAVTIFLAPPSFQELRRRLENRGDTAPEKIESRLKQARWEVQQAEQYTYLLVNDQVDDCVARMEAILADSPEAQQSLYANNTNLDIFKEVL